MNKRLAWITIFIFFLGLVLSSCITTQKPTASNFKDPVITLESFMVPQYDGYYYYGAGIKPTKGEAGNHGSPLPMTFLFNIRNPNPYPIELQDFKFTVNFDKEFDVVTVNVQDSTWVPANGTNNVRATTLITTHSALLSLLVTGGYVLKKKGWSPWDALERWWTGVPDMSVPVAVKDASFTFDAGGVLKVLPFKADVS
jgi:hypothetical protein